MATVVGVWSQILTSGKPVVVSPAADIRITNVALGDVVADASSRTTVKLTYPDPAGGADEDSDEDMEDVEDAPKELISTVVCSLTPGKLEQTTTDLVLLKEEAYTFESVGKNTIYLTGNYIDQYPEPLHDDFSDSDMDSDEEAYDLREVSSDVEIDADELDSDASRFEEVIDLPKSAKRPRDSDVADTPKTKADKKANKKLKADDGKAVPTENGEPKTKKDKKEKKEKSETKEKSTPAQKELPGGLKIKDSKVGTGPMAKKGDTVLMRYIGKLQNGKVFDQNVKGKPFSFHLGKGEVIKGWDEGLVGMQAGGERVLTIPPQLAYGKKSVSSIPANSTLTFECKLVGLK